MQVKSETTEVSYEENFKDNGWRIQTSNLKPKDNLLIMIKKEKHLL